MFVSSPSADTGPRHPGSSNLGEAGQSVTETGQRGGLVSFCLDSHFEVLVERFHHMLANVCISVVFKFYLR